MTLSMMIQKRSRRCFQTEEAPEKLEPKKGNQLWEFGKAVALRLREIVWRTWSWSVLESSVEMSFGGSQSWSELVLESELEVHPGV